MAELETATREIELKPGAVFPFGAEKFGGACWISTERPGRCW